MGYSARYHAASLAAVFLALGIGILIGVSFGDDVVSGTSERLEESLQGDLEQARGELDDLRVELSRQQLFAERVYPVLVGGRLRGQRVALIALGGLPDDVASDVEAALDPTGARLGEVAVVRQPPDMRALSDAARETAFGPLRGNRARTDALARTLGRQLVRGGALLARVEEELLSRSSGSPRGIDDVVLVRNPPDGLEGEEAERTERFEAALLRGLQATQLPLVGVERSDTEATSVGVFDSRGISTVDNVDAVAGRLAMVSVLLGAEGNFGVKESADQLLPDLLVPPRRPPRRP